MSLYLSFNTDYTHLETDFHPENNFYSGRRGNKTQTTPNFSTAMLESEMRSGQQKRNYAALPEMIGRKKKSIPYR